MDRARAWFATHIDGTFKDQYAQFTDAVSWHNEIWANSQTAAEQYERVRASEAAVWVWNTEYRPTFANDIKLVIGEAAIGNDMPREIAELAIFSDSILGYHPYTLWQNKQRNPDDWQYLSGRWDGMEQSWNLRPTWAFTEAGPFEGVVDGWKSSKCLGGDPDLYVEAMRQWIQDCQQTNAYQQGRIVGFNLFTTGGGDTWKYYETDQPELDALADMIAVEWKPGTAPPPPPPPPDDECRGGPRVQYHRIYNVLHNSLTEEQEIEIFLDAKKRGRQTVGWSYDDAGIGDLDNRTATLHGIPEDEESVFLDWYAAHYPGVVVEFVDPPPIDGELVALSQRDPRWADHTIGQNTGHGKTIGNWGCLLVVYNMMAAYYELTEQLPGTYNIHMLSAGAFVGQYLKPGALQAAHPGNISYEGFLNRDNNRMIPKIGEWLNAGKPVPARVDFNPSTEAWEQHWVLLLEERGDDYLMADPWTGKTGLLSEAYDVPGVDVLEALFYQMI